MYPIAFHMIWSQDSKTGFIFFLEWFLENLLLKIHKKCLNIFTVDGYWLTKF